MPDAEEGKCEKSLFPESLTLEERAYYRDTWGFDPVVDKKVAPPPPGVLYYYTSPILLESDPELRSAGVTMHARVEVDVNGKPHNRIVFARGEKSAKVECVHTAVYAAPTSILQEIPQEKLKDLVTSTEGLPVILPPWEHFVGLKSFASGIGAVGILGLLDPILQVHEGDLEKIPVDRDGEIYINFKDTPLSWELMIQLYHSLLEVVPGSFRLHLMQRIVELVGRAPVEWLVAHWEAIQYDYGLYRNLIDAQFVSGLSKEIRRKLTLLYLRLYHAGNIYDEEGIPGGICESLPLILSDDVLEILDKNELEDLFDSFVELDLIDIFPPSERDDVDYVFTTLFCDMIAFTFEKFLDPKYLLRAIGRIKEQYLFREASTFLTDINKEYLGKLLMSIISIWKMEGCEDEFLGKLPYLLLVQLLISGGNSDHNQIILKELNAVASSEWYREYLVPLSRAKMFNFVREILGDHLQREIQRKEEEQRILSEEEYDGFGDEY